MKSKYWTKAKEFGDGLPTEAHFKVVEEEISEDLKDGEVLTNALYVALDPYVRAFPIPPGTPLHGLQVARVLESKNDKYPKGSVVLQTTGWRTISKSSDTDIWYRVDNVEPKIALTHPAGALGMPGLTAHMAFLDICQPKAGETVMINACAGAVGNLVGQIAKIKGCKVIGCCGSQEKMDFSKSVGFDEVFNYKTDKPWSETLKRVAPNGIDCFFDNVGGQLSSDIMAHMNSYGRVCVIGYIASYNNTQKVQADIVQPSIVPKQLLIQGFLIFDPRYKPRFQESVKAMAKWIHEGKIQVRETLYDGFENIPKAFIGILKGANIGKAVVRLQE